ncbi:MAG: D-alanyl-D-alanine carboxypeptidase [Stappia sp.]|nr:D-alanyl-D-alanine carboxypeptidase [Stappia sp.]
MPSNAVIRLAMGAGRGVLSLVLAMVLFAGVLAAGSAPARAGIGAWIVVDMETGAVLDQQAARRQWYPASITKLMTAYLTFKAMREGRADKTSVVTVSANAHSMPPSKIGFKPGTRITLDTALKMLIVKSVNDIAVAVAESIGGSEPGFIAMMNEEARRLGMSATHFVNPHGLPDNGQVSSARDLAVLARALWREFPEHRHYFQVAGLRLGNKLLKSANREFLARVPGANGMKTGYVCNSGLNVVVTATRGGRTVMAVILGAASGVERAAKARVLLEDGFRTRSGRSLDQLTGVSGRPPADGYCKRNERPSAEDLMAAYAGGGSRSGGSVLSFAAAGVSRPPALQGLAAPVAGDDDDDVPTKENGKTDWAKVMDEVIGPRQRDNAPIRVSVAVPAGATPPRVAGVPASAIATVSGGVAAPGIPLPTPKPFTVAAGNDGPAAGAILVPSSPSSADAAPKPGSIFRGKPLVIVPRPLAAPRP